ncbi:MAG TPA: hypothetical protein VNO30_01955 [Kofleriaceae bacterium]|nr:hypothetical protein [Kofleriaceae bacterium]
MNRIPVVDNSLISVWVYPEQRLIHHQMKRFCFGNDFREALTRGVEAMQQYGATKWLSDDRANSALPPDDGQWGTEVWFPRAKAAGWKHWAIVQPRKILGQTNMDRFARQFGDQGINARMFTDPDEALRWLEAL